MIVEEHISILITGDDDMMIAGKPKMPTIHITESAYRKLRLYADICKDEISALGCVSHKNGDFLIHDIHLFEQAVTSGSTDMSPGDVSKFLYEYVRAGKNPEDLKFWWHSHATMGVFWSGIDEGTITRFNNGWMISMVSNKQGNHLVRLDIFDPLRLVLELPLEVTYDVTAKDRDEIAKEISEKVSTKFFGRMMDNFMGDFGRPPVIPHEFPLTGMEVTPSWFG
jgi:hypothetical protein